MGCCSSARVAEICFSDVVLYPVLDVHVAQRGQIVGQFRDQYQHAIIGEHPRQVLYTRNRLVRHALKDMWGVTLGELDQDSFQT